MGRESSRSKAEMYERAKKVSTCGAGDPNVQWMDTKVLVRDLDGSSKYLAVSADYVKNPSWGLFVLHSSCVASTCFCCFLLSDGAYNVGAEKIIQKLFESDELVLQADGSLAKQFRMVGTNKVGMLAWHVVMRTPEYPGGRELVIIANDVTFQSGSFGVREVS